MKNKLSVSLIILSLLAGQVIGQTGEARGLNYGQEVDITFWQTLPFAVFWGHLIERQISALILPGSPAHWNAIALFAVTVSLGNALVRSRNIVIEKKGAR